MTRTFQVFHLLAASGWSLGALAFLAMAAWVVQRVVRDPAIPAILVGTLIALAWLYVAGGCARRARRHASALSRIRRTGALPEDR